MNHSVSGRSSLTTLISVFLTHIFREILKNAKKTEDQLKIEIKNHSAKLESSQKQINDQKNDFNSKLEEKELLLDKQIGLLKSTTEDLAKGSNYQ